MAVDSNYVYVANFNDNTVSIIKTTDNEVVGTLNTSDRPAFIASHPAQGKISVVCLGRGKENESEGKTDAAFSIFNTPQNTLQKNLPLTRGAVVAKDQYPKSAGGSSGGLVYARSGDLLFKADTKNPVAVLVYKVVGAGFVDYSNTQDMLVVGEKKGASYSLGFYDQNAGRKNGVGLPGAVICAYPVR